MKAIGEACQVIGSKSYIRVYERVGDTDQYQPIALILQGCDMQRFHDPRNDPLPMHSPQHAIERARLAQQTAEFLSRGGKVQVVGHCMSSAPATFTINPERSPVYAHLFAPVAAEAAPEAQALPKPATELAGQLIKSSRP